MLLVLLSLIVLLVSSGLAFTLRSKPARAQDAGAYGAAAASLFGLLAAGSPSKADFPC